jgi:hypothetical protein
MKELIKILLKNHLLKEGKQVGVIYHYTNVRSAIGIINSNSMYKHKETFNNSKVEHKGISFTRDKLFNINTRLIEKDPFVRMAFDGDKISNNFNVTPFNAFPNSTRDIEPQKLESEIRVGVGDNQKFEPIKYLLNVTLDVDKAFNYIHNLKYSDKGPEENRNSELKNELANVEQLRNICERYHIEFNLIISDKFKQTKLYKTLQKDNYLNENVQQTNKLYGKTGILTPEEIQKVLAITNGDNYTRLVADTVAHFKQFNDSPSNYVMVKNLYNEIKTYNKNLFPLKNNLFDYTRQSNERGKHTMDLIELMNERKLVINTFNKFSPLAIRNLKSVSQHVYDNKYELVGVREKLHTLLGCIKILPKSERGQKVFNKIFNSQNNLDRMVEIAKHYSNAFMPANEEDKDDLLEVLPLLNVELIQDSNNVLVIKVNDSEAMQRIGCTSAWCFSLPNSSEYWYDYAQHGFVYVIFDFNQDNEDAKFLMVLLPDTGTIYAGSNVPLSELEIDDDMEYLRDIGVDINELNHEPEYSNREGDDEDDDY